MNVLSFLKYWKMLLGLIGAVVIGFFVFDYHRLKENSIELENSLEEAVEVSEKLESDYKALEVSLEGYQQSLKDSQVSQNRLKNQLEDEAQKDEHLEECFNTELPPNLINSLSE